MTSRTIRARRVRRHHRRRWVLSSVEARRLMLAAQDGHVCRPYTVSLAQP